jgi:trans-aconitate methyltransferase
MCDVSKAAIIKASQLNPDMEFFELNIIENSRDFKADLVTALKTLYYCAPEIDITINNIYEMLLPSGFLAYSYNIKNDSFTKKFLDIETLREKLINRGFKRIFISDYFYTNKERITIDIYKKTSK